MVDKSAAKKAMNAANVDFKAKNFKGALEKYTEAIKLDPEESTYPSNRANVHLKLKQWKEAETDATTALKMKPNHAKVNDKCIQTASAYKETQFPFCQLCTKVD